MDCPIEREAGSCAGFWPKDKYVAWSLPALIIQRWARVGLDIKEIV